MAVIGFHVGPGGNPTGIGDYVRQLDAAAIPCCVVSADVTTGISDALFLINGGSTVPHNLIYRVVRDGNETYSLPNYNLSPADAAAAYWNLILPLVPPEIKANRQHVWIQLVNEPDKSRADWLGWFAVNIATLANAQGYKVSLFGWSAGEPEPEHWETPGMLAYLDYCAGHFDAAAISVHEYSYQMNMANAYPYLIGRFTNILNAAAANGIPYPRIHITEFGWTYNDLPDVAAAMNDVAWAHSIYAPYPHAVCAAIWYLGAGFGDIANKAQRLIAPVTTFNINNPPTPPTPPVPPVNYKVVAHLPPQTISRAEYDLIADEAIPLKQSVVFSADDAARLVAPGLPGSKVLAWWPERWQDDIVAWLNGKGVAIVETRPLAPPTPGFRLSSPVQGIPLTITNGGQFNAYRDYDDPRYKAHEGLDLRGVNSSGQAVKVVAAALGIVDGIRFVDPGKGYGIYVRVRTLYDGTTYILWYGHLANVAAALTIGQAVAVGQELGLAGNTGNSFGIHLHLTVQKVPGGLSGYIVDNVIDPAPLLGLPPTTLPGPGDEPEPEPTYKYNGPPVVFSPALHAPGSDWEWGLPQVQSLYDKVKLPVKWLSNGVSASYWGRFNKPSFHLIRVFWKSNEKKTPQQAWDQDIRDGVLSFYANGGRNFELLNEPNIEGVNVNWSNGDELGAWLSGLATIIKSNCPEARLYFPGMSPGVPWTNQFTWTNKAWAIVKPQCYGFCMHTYTGIVNDEVAAANEIVTQVKELQVFLNLQVPLVISESSVNRAAAPDYKVRVYRRVENALKTVPGIQAVCWFVSSWSDAPSGEDGNQESWVKYGIGDAYVST